MKWASPVRIRQPQPRSAVPVVESWPLASSCRRPRSWSRPPPSRLLLRAMGSRFHPWEVKPSLGQGSGRAGEQPSGRAAAVSSGFGRPGLRGVGDFFDLNRAER
ncbi:hypothetical protein E2562_021233 [Oryza meyeriana var. granulata]|uniref:Uncharacterized protein n=1 Tax=Oryza meyeriana var. granulata TaxID=110450 RepID=A0A6G1DXY9_9ORYZ|nr:hypothetical protein E2562_021233 [Oryza meyeriana var. granulata]